MKDKKSILLVEDNAMIQFAVRIILDDFPCNLEIAETGQQALDLGTKNQYDLILMDIGLPDISGDLVTKALKKLPQYQKLKIPILALSAHTTKQIIENCKNAGMEEYIIKPLTKENCQKIFATYFK